MFMKYTHMRLHIYLYKIKGSNNKNYTNLQNYQLQQMNASVNYQYFYYLRMQREVLKQRLIVSNISKRQVNAQQSQRINQLRSRYLNSKVNKQLIKVNSNNTIDKQNIEYSFKKINLNNICNEKLQLCVIKNTNQKQNSQMKKTKDYQNSFINQNSQEFLPKISSFKKYNSNASSINSLNNSSSKISTKSSIYKEEFNKKVQKVNQNIQEGISKLQRQLSILRQQIKDKQSSKQTNKTQQPFKQYSIKKQSLIKPTVMTKPMQQPFSLNDQQFRQSYAKKLKQTNYLQKMKQQLLDIQNQRTINIYQPVQKVSQVYSNTIQNQVTKTTLANLTPFLAQSQIVQWKGEEILNKLKGKQLIKHKDEVINQKETQYCQSPINHEFKQLTESNIDEIANSRIDRKQLHGQLKIQNESNVFQQFTSLINRLAYQVQNDNKFTQQLLRYQYIDTNQGNLKDIIKQKVKNAFQQTGQFFNQNIFNKCPMEIDPLHQPQRLFKTYSNQQIAWLVRKIMKKFKDLNYFYTQKLSNRFSYKTVQFFIKEIQKCHNLNSEQNINIGHLTSYINMRTGKNFRNRYFCKILKRINNQQTYNSILNRNNLLKALSKE